MYIATLQLVSSSPYSQSRARMAEKTDQETHQQFEERTWRDHLNVSQSGHVFIPAMAFKLSIIKAAQLLGIQKADSKNEKYTKHFETEVQIAQSLILPFKPKDPAIKCEWIFAHSQPTRMKTSGRVWRAYPTIQEWKGELEVLVVGKAIPESIFMEVVEYAGVAVGIGRWRPENRGVYGQYKVKSHKWEKK